MSNFDSAPLAANSFEVAAPTPRLPPVTSAVLPANDDRASLLFMNMHLTNTSKDMMLFLMMETAMMTYESTSH